MNHLRLFILFLVCSLGYSQFVDFSVTTQTYYGQFAPMNCVAVWITDNADRFVKTVKLAAYPYRGALRTWRVASDSNFTDAVTGASRLSQGSMNAVWDGTDTLGRVAPDGAYKLWLEMTEHNSQLGDTLFGPLVAVPFNKSGRDTVVRPANVQFTDRWNLNPQKGVVQTVFTGMTLSYYKPGPGVLQFRSAYVSGREGRGRVAVIVERRLGRTGAVTVNYSLRDSTARAGTDYTAAASGQVAFPDGSIVPETIWVNLINDTQYKGLRFAVLNLSGAGGGAALGSVVKTVLRIYDNDVPTPDSGLVAQFAFDEGSGLTAFDASGCDNLGVFQRSAWWPTGRRGSCAAFNGTSDYVSISDSRSLSLLGPLSISLWIYPQKSGIIQTFFASSPPQYTLWQQANNLFRFADAHGHGLDAPAGKLVVNKWNHVVAVFSGAPNATVTSANTRIYVNAVSTGGTIIAGTWTPDACPMAAVTIGSKEFQGRIDEINVYNRALPLAEIQKLYSDTLVPSAVENASLGIADETLVRAWPSPFRTAVFFESGKISVSTDVSVFAPTGQRVAGFTVAPGGRAVWEAQNKPSGIYIVRAAAGGENRSFRIPLQR